MLDRFSVARALREIASLMQVEGANPFKVRAYERGARALEGMPEDLGTLVREGRLTSVPGIGSALPNMGMRASNPVIRWTIAASAAAC